MKNQVIPDPSRNAWRVVYEDQVCVPTFPSEEDAKAYLNALEKFLRKPDYGYFYTRVIS